MFGAEQPVDDDVAPVVNLVDEDAARDAEIGCALQLFVTDRADVLEPQPVIGARVLFQRRLVDVEELVSTPLSPCTWQAICQPSGK